MAMYMFLLLNYMLKNGWDGRSYVMYILCAHVLSHV